MTDLIQFFDDVNVLNLPANMTHGAYYMDGRYDNEKPMKARFPHAQLFSITVESANADACDCEPGDMTIAETIAWVERRLKAGAYRPIVYADGDHWENQGLKADLAHYGSKIRRWVAAYPGTGANVPAGFDMHQYATGVLDTNVGLMDCFDKKPPKPAHDTGVAVAQIKVNAVTGVPHIHHMPGTVKFAGAKHVYEFHGSLKGGKGGGTWSIRRGK